MENNSCDIDVESVEYNNFLGIPPELSECQSPAFRVFTVPYERTTSYRAGTADGPEAILEASRQVELFDLEIGTRICDKGVATDRSLDDFCSGDFQEFNAAARKAVSNSIKAREIPVVLGGEHTISESAVAATLEQYPDLTVVQIDAHADLRAAYEGDAHSHACAMARVLDIAPGSPALVQVGIRSACSCEMETINTDKRVTLFPALSIHKGEVSMDDILEACGEDVYLTIDLDGLDPAEMPGVGTPEPGGLTWLWTTEFIARLSRQSRIRAFDVVELCPVAGDNRSEFIAAKLTYRIMGLIGLSSSK